MTDIVKYFHSGMAGAPQMSNARGHMIAVLDACLKDGFNALTPTGIVSAAGIATATYGTTHGYEVDQVILVAGCDQTAYNGEKRVLSVPTNTTLTFAVVGTPTSPATSATVFNTKAAPLGFAKIFSATNKAMYQSQNLSTNQWVLRLDGTAWTGYSTGKGVEYKVDICRTATGIDAMIENTTAKASATYGQFRWRQSVASAGISSAAPTANIEWALYGNDKTFYFMVGWAEYNPRDKAVYGFGEIKTYKTGDPYNTFLMADNTGPTGGVTTDNFPALKGFNCKFNGPCPLQETPQSDIIIAKAHTGIGAWVQGSLVTVGLNNSSIILSGGGTSGIPVVNPQDLSVLFFGAYVMEAVGFRGELGGVYAIPNRLVDLEESVGFDGAKYTQSLGGTTKTIRVSRCSDGATATAFIGLDITGPW